jgi:hypothetical protein
MTAVALEENQMGIKMFKTELFPYIDGLSLKGIRVNLVMDKVTSEMLPNGRGGEDAKYVLYFEGSKKGLVLNKTNVKRIIKIVGSDDTEDWKGKTICVYSEKVKAFGEVHDAVRVGPSEAKAIVDGGKKAPAKKAPLPELTDEEFNAALFDAAPEPTAQSPLLDEVGNGAYQD